jgi:hypothetical protein
MEYFDRSKLDIKPLSERKSKTDVSFIINPDSTPPKISHREYSRLEKIASIIKKTKEQNVPIVFAFGAHLIKNGLSEILIELMKGGYVSHILGNGAVSIHDWELAFQGKTEEDVREYIRQGQFGLWEETGSYINRAIKEHKDQGYGTAVGKFISGGILRNEQVSHPFKKISILGNAHELGIPVSICPQIGCDIIYTHSECDGAAIGKAGYTDFLKFVNTISRLEGGTYISIGSAITSPMVFEKALSMAKNIARQKNRILGNYHIVVNDVQKGKWDWSKGEPPKNNPAYYLRFMKTFSRAGGTLEYIQMDNRAFLHNLYHFLK